MAGNCAKNLMTVANLGVCFGPTLMRPEEETMKAIMEIKFSNIIIEILISNYHKVSPTYPLFLDEDICCTFVSCYNILSSYLLFSVNYSGVDNIKDINGLIFLMLYISIGVSGNMKLSQLQERQHCIETLLDLNTCVSK